MPGCVADAVRRERDGLPDDIRGTAPATGSRLMLSTLSPFRPPEMCQKDHLRVLARIGPAIGRLACRSIRVVVAYLPTLSIGTLISTRTSARLACDVRKIVECLERSLSMGQSPPPELPELDHTVLVDFG